MRSKNRLYDIARERLATTWKPLKTVIITAFILPLGFNHCLTPSAVAQSATWGETMSLTSILIGYENIVLGLDEIGMGGEIDVIDHSLIFSDTIAAFTMIGRVGDMELILNGNGSLLGDVGSEDIGWTGNWLGTLGNQFLIADDSGNFTFDETNGYTQLNFSQSGSKDFVDIWDVQTTGDLTSNINDSLLPGWARPGTEGIGGAVSQVQGDLENGNMIGSFLTIDDKFFSLVSDDGTVIKEGFYICAENKNCIKTPIPEPTPTAALFFLLSLGVMPIMSRFKAVGSDS